MNCIRWFKAKIMLRKYKHFECSQTEWAIEISSIQLVYAMQYVQQYAIYKMRSNVFNPINECGVHFSLLFFFFLWSFIHFTELNRIIVSIYGYSRLFIYIFMGRFEIVVILQLVTWIWCELKWFKHNGTHI